MRRTMRPSTPARSNHPLAASFFLTSSRGMIRYAARPCGPRAVISRASASSADTRRLSSSVMTTAATLRPEKFTCPTPGAFHVEMKSTDAAAASVPQIAIAVRVVPACRTVYLLLFPERELEDEAGRGIAQTLVANGGGIGFFDGALGDPAPDHLPLPSGAGQHRVQHERTLGRDAQRRRGASRESRQSPVRHRRQELSHV